MSKKNIHPRACPVCGVIVDWTRTPARKTLPNGETVTVQLHSLECPEHGPFDNITDRLNAKLSRVMREVVKDE